jgi:hypothetical protein
MWTMSDDDIAQAQLVRTSDQLAQVIAAVADLAKLRRATGFMVPVLEEDPDPDDPTNVWMFADGQINSRTPDGNVHRYSENTGAPYNLPTFASPPAFSSGHRIWLNGTTGNMQAYLQNGTLQTYAAVVPTTSSSGGGPTVPPPTSTVPKPTDPKPQSYRKTYDNNWSRTFCDRHGVESDDHYGEYDGTHGERRIMFGFPDGTMRSDLSGATITKVELKMRNTYAWSYGGITVHMGLHTKDTAPGSFSQNRKDVYVSDWPRSGWGGGSDHWRTVSSSIGRRFRDDDCRGMTIDQPGGRTLYGACDRDSLSLRISYTK